MKIKKNDKLRVCHMRFGVFDGIALEDFDTDDKDLTFFPIALNQPMLCGLSTDFVKGDCIPCRNILCRLTVLEEIQ